MKRPPIVAGLLFVALGVLLLLGEAGVVDDAGEVLGRWWPLALVLVGLGQASLPPRNPAGGAVVAVIGAALLLRTLDVVDALAYLWPVVLIAVGVWLITGRSRRTPDRLTLTEDGLSVVTVFGDRRFAAEAVAFPGGDVTTVFGDVDLDLQRAHLTGEATIQATTIFGDLDLTVPAGWRVRTTGPQIFGDVRIDEPLDPDGPVLVLRLLTVFGDVEVRHARTAAV